MNRITRTRAEFNRYSDYVEYIKEHMQERLHGVFPPIEDIENRTLGELLAYIEALKNIADMYMAEISDGQFAGANKIKIHNK